MKSATVADIDKWLAAMATGAEQDVVPDGFVTVLDLSDCLGRDRSTIAKNLRLLEARGLAERRSFRVKSGAKVHPVEHWRLIG